jgi:glycosyltransferase involved in cell wall biosynthesis
VQIEHAFCAHRRRDVGAIADRVAVDQPDWVVLQFNQFSFGRWGLNPFLPLAIRSIRRRSPATRIAVMFHEDFVPPSSWKFRIMRVWQKWQFKALGRAADVVLFSIDPWVGRYASWFPGRRVMHMPVGSNIPQIKIARGDARSRLGIANDAVVLALFGSAHAKRNLPWVQAAVRAARTVGLPVILLYVGANVETAREAAGNDTEMIADGTLPPDEVSRRIAAADIYLAPFSDGISTRRTSMLSGLQHGIAVVGTRGEATDEMLLRENGRSFVLTAAEDVQAYGDAVVKLALDQSRRQELAARGAELYRREFDWEVIARRFLKLFACADSHAGIGAQDETGDAGVLAPHREIVV